MSPAPSILAGTRSATASFPTLEEIKVVLGIDPADTTKDAAITSGVIATIAMIETYLGRGIKRETVIGERFEPIDTRDPKLFLWRFPVESVTEVRVEGAPVAGWRVYPRQGVLNMGRGSSMRGECCGEGALTEVDYIGGYADDAWPPDLVEAVMRAFYGRWSVAFGAAGNAPSPAGRVKSWTADGLSVSMTDPSIGMGSQEAGAVIPPDLANVAAMLDAYRVRFVRGV